MNIHWRTGALSWGACCATVVVLVANTAAGQRAVPSDGAWTARDGLITFTFDAAALEALKLDVAAQGAVSAGEMGGAAEPISFVIEPSSSLAIRKGRGRLLPDGGRLQTCGALLALQPGGRSVIANPSLAALEDGTLVVAASADDGEAGTPVWMIASPLIDVGHLGELHLIGDVVITDAWARAIGAPELAWWVIGSVEVIARTESKVEAAEDPVDTFSDFGGVAGPDVCPTAEGPDVVVADLQSVVRYGSVGGITAFAVGTTACNFGTERANWVAHTNEHPVILQNLYRLMDGQFEQIGMAWVKHGFYAVSQCLCCACNPSTGACYDPTSGSQLGVGCSDPYSANLNGVQTNMSPRSEVDAHTGYFVYQLPEEDPQTLIDRRLQVHDEDLAPDLNLGARYFVEGHYVNPDDALAGNHDNNASYREVGVVEPAANTYALTFLTGKQTQREQPAVRAWHDINPEVVETEIRVPGEGLFILAAHAVDVGGGTWRYSYALQNLNSDRSARAFSVPLPVGAVVTNIGFHDVDYHSGEPFDDTDWSAEVAEGAITWSTDTYDVNKSANALRYSTTYSFYFTTPIKPTRTTVTVELFKPGFPGSVSGTSIGPEQIEFDCNDNGRPDLCDVRCAEGCDEPCGTSADCNANDIPDECEPDCDEDGIPDECEIRDCAPDDLSCQDCNSNTVPDGCETDCNDDGYPDDCVPPPDTDGDGINDCFDLCPETTPEGVCACPPLGQCCWSGVCLPDYPRDACIQDGGTPECIEAPCRQGCLIGDYDGDGDLDLSDAHRFWTCFSGPSDATYYMVPSQECSIPFDYDEDDDVDWSDFRMFQGLTSGP